MQYKNDQQFSASAKEPVNTKLTRLLKEDTECKSPVLSLLFKHKSLNGKVKHTTIKH